MIKKQNYYIIDINYIMKIYKTKNGTPVIIEWFSQYDTYRTTYRYDLKPFENRNYPVFIWNCCESRCEYHPENTCSAYKIYLENMKKEE